NIARAGALDKLVHPHRLCAAAVAEVIAHQPLQLGEPALGHAAQRPAQLEDRRVGEPIADKEALLAALDQPSLAQRLQMLRGIGQRDPDLVGERLGAALALGEQLEQLEPVRAGQGLPDAGELSVEAVLEEAVRVGHSQVINILVEYCCQASTGSACRRRMVLMPRVLDPEGAHLAALRRLQDFTGARVVEVGCGDGRLTPGIAERAASVLAFDPDADAVARARAALPDALAGRVTYRVDS